MTCRWTEDEDGVWHTACGRTWILDNEGPAENGVRYCFCCGKRVEAVKYEPKEDES